MATKHYYNETTYETRGYEYNIDVSKYIDLTKWNEYIIGQEPQSLVNAIEARNSQKQIEVVTRVQAMKAMKQTGTLWADFNALLASNQDAKDEWDLAIELQRNNPFTLQLAPVLGLTTAQLDDLFQLASTL